jgi:MFS family permease
VALAIVFVTRTSMGYQFQAIASVGPLLVTDLQLSWAQLGSLIGLYLLPGAFLALPGGILGQRLGERRTVVGSLALMIVGGIVTAAAHGYAAALVGRVLAGIGAVLMNVVLAKMVADWFAGGGMSIAMAIMLTSWPVGLGLAAATIGGLATRTSWRTAILVTAAVSALGLLLIAFVYRDPPCRKDVAAPAEESARLSAREIALGTTGGFAWGCFNASLVAVIAFGPGLLTARGLSLADAGYVVSAAILLTMVSVPLGGLLTDRLGRPNLIIVAGSVVAAIVMTLLPVIDHSLLAFCLVGLAIGAPPGGLMALLPNAVAPARLATSFGVYYTVFYVMMAAIQSVAGVVRDVSGSAAAPVLFAALVMATTVLGLALFRIVEHASRRAPAAR